MVNVAMVRGDEHAMQSDQAMQATKRELQVDLLWAAVLGLMGYYSSW
jgi:hypothetical protein